MTIRAPTRVGPANPGASLPEAWPPELTLPRPRSGRQDRPLARSGSGHQHVIPVEQIAAELAQLERVPHPVRTRSELEAAELERHPFRRFTGRRDRCQRARSDLAPDHRPVPFRNISGSAPNFGLVLASTRAWISGAHAVVPRTSSPATTSGPSARALQTGWTWIPLPAARDPPRRTVYADAPGPGLRPIMMKNPPSRFPVST